MKNVSDISKIIHKEGYIFVVIFAAISFLFSSFSTTLGNIGFLMTAWCIYFFRNPERHTPILENMAIAPADGVVQSIVDAVPPAELELGDQEMKRVSIFLSVFNVHVNRIPVDGKIIGLHYHPGKFFNASMDKASVHNERQSILIEANDGTKIGCIQIAGLIARRIVCDLEEGESVKAGARFGIIRFGSRVDLYLPKKSMINVCEGQTCVGGETIIANLKPGNKVDQMQFEVR